MSFFFLISISHVIETFITSYSRQNFCLYRMNDGILSVECTPNVSNVCCSPLCVQNNRTTSKNRCTDERWQRLDETSFETTVIWLDSSALDQCRPSFFLIKFQFRFSIYRSCKASYTHFQRFFFLICTYRLTSTNLQKKTKNVAKQEIQKLSVDLQE